MLVRHLLVTVLLLAACTPTVQSATQQACVEEAAKAQARCLKVAFEKCGKYDDPDQCPAAAEVDKACDQFIDEELQQCR